MFNASRACILSVSVLYCGAAQASDAEFLLTRRADVLGSLAGEASFLIRSSSGVEGKYLENEFSGRLGLGRDFMLRVSASQGLSSAAWKPAAGLQWQFMGTQAERLAMSVSAQYRKGALTEPDGEGEADVSWSGAYRDGPLEFTMNVLGGVDLDGDTRHFETHFVAGYNLSAHWLAGIETESRWALRSSTADLSNAGDPGADGFPAPLNSVDNHFAGPFVQYRIDRFTLSGAGGVSVYREVSRETVTNPQGLFRASFSF